MTWKLNTASDEKKTITVYIFSNGKGITISFL